MLGKIERVATRLAVAVTCAGILAACAEQGPTTSAPALKPSLGINVAPAPLTPPVLVLNERVRVCKTYAEGSGPNVDILAELDLLNDGSFETSGTVNVASGTCVEAITEG